MHWFGGSIADAVTLSKQKNAIFVVFVEGDNDLSAEMASTIDSDQVVLRLSNQDNFLAVKLKSGSTNYTHFAQIYQFVPVPSLFFIGRNGTPLEVVCAGVQPDNLATRIDRILDEHLKDKTSGAASSPVQPSTSSQNLRQETANLINAEGSATAAQQGAKNKNSETGESSSGPPSKLKKVEHEVTKSGKEYEVVCDDEVCVRRLKVKTDEPGPSSASVAAATPIETVEANVADKPADNTQPNAVDSVAEMEEKMERAKELIEARRREKAEKEKELERKKELERRALGQNVAELKRWQADEELKHIQEERKREKMENNLARQRILEQIAQDRAERKAREATEVPPQPQFSAAPHNTVGDASAQARIQFKLPDGSSHTAHFEAEGTLGDVQRYVADNLQLSRSNFSLWTAFPRRELTEVSATLRHLQLTPSAALLVLPRRQPTAVATPSTFANVLAFLTQLFTTFILEPSQQLYNWIRIRLFPPSEPSNPRPPTGLPPTGPIGGTVRRRGNTNIHRLGEGRTGDDDNNTWNGNSTQQM